MQSNSDELGSGWRRAPATLTVVAGPAGAGKSTLLRNLRDDAQGMKLGLIASGWSRSRPPLDVRWDGLFWMAPAHEGAGFGASPSAAFRSARRAALDHVLFEADGATDPYLLRGLAPAGTTERPVRLLAVVDEKAVERLFGWDGEIGVEEGAGTHLVSVRQIEDADVVVLNRSGEIDPGRRRALIAFLADINAKGTVVASPDGRLDPDLAFGRWQGEDWVRVDETAPTRGMARYLRRRPFHPFRLSRLLASPRGKLLRVRGLVWLATCPDAYEVLSLAGRHHQIAPGGRFWAAMPDDELPFDEALLAELASYWELPWGDRRQDLHAAAFALDTAAVFEALDACLLTDDEMRLGPEEWLAFPCPFVEWQDGDLRPDVWREPTLPVAG